MLTQLSNDYKTTVVTADPCPKTTSEWAEQKLNFHPSPKQAEVLNTDAKYLILCCNRQWVKQQQSQ